MKGPTSCPWSEGLQLRHPTCKSQSQHFPRECTEESSCPLWDHRIDGNPPWKSQAGCQRESQRVPSRGCRGNRRTLSSLCFFPFLRSSQQQQPPVCMSLGIVIPFSPCSFSYQGKPHSVLKLFRVTGVEGSRTANQC